MALKCTLLSHVPANNFAAKISQTDSYESADATTGASYDNNLAGNIFGAILQRYESTHYGLDQVIEKHANLDEDLGNHDVMCSRRQRIRE